MVRFVSSRFPFFVLFLSCWLFLSLVSHSVAFASEQPEEALFITRYEFGPPTIEQKSIDDFACHAFTVADTTWRMEKALTFTSSVPVFYRSIQDIAPAAKGHLFFGLDASNNLCLFDGKPAHRRILRRFDHLSLPAVRASVPKATYEQLKQGIPIQTIDEYRSVLSTFIRYSDMTS
ncbi:BofC C-terminal domain-containing protein [Fodinisporobacter ferrooxydans]|uniref:BofC C-terminal domain-containing protein n=1 Tax=Fodinisporobacter ferrooxydans TaxID=2901836 RepID=A0ABY4CQF3_9BACL|nr:BofC C-terminal domain-containing protein [Alicyclobacillaceae bacterium MYW30-H2]